MLKNKTFDFVGNLKKILIISGALLLIGLVCTFVFGPVLDISFQGGTKISYSFTGKIDTESVRKLADETLGKKTTVAITSGVSDTSQKLIVSLADNEALGTESIDALGKALTEAYADNEIEQAEVNSVNPSVGTVFFLKCLVAVVIAAILVIAYVAFRFRKIGGVSAAVAALIALVHDVAIAFFAAVVLRLSIDSNFIAVVMTLLGYSLNNTIVVFDRIRENRRVYGSKKPLDELVNLSDNQVLARNIMTSLSTVIAILTVFVVCEITGLTSLRTLTIPMMFGLVAGSFSSICIAPALWVKWRQLRSKKKEG